MNKKNNYNAFTFIELVIAISILVILTVLGFISYTKSLEDTRDSQRESDLTYVSNALKLYKTKRGNYPLPGETFSIVNSGTVVAYQGKLLDSLIISTIDKIPLDPFVNIPYVYSIWNNNQEYQLATTLENNGIYKARLIGDYKTVSNKIVPTIVLAISTYSDVEVNENVGSGAYNRKKFVFNNGTHNLPYTFEDPYLPYYDDTNFTGLLNEPSVKWNQLVDYSNCNDILLAGKNIGTGEYQINNYGVMENIVCGTSKLPKNCKEIKSNNSGASSGVYSIMPENISRSFGAYCDMSTAGGGWTLVAKDGSAFDYSIGHCNFMDPPNNTTKSGPFIFWACDLNQKEMLFWTPSGWVVGTNKVKEDCSINSTKINNNTCSWTGASQTFSITQSGGCMTGYTSTGMSMAMWWKGYNRESTFSKNLSGLSSILNGECNTSSGIASTSYCELFDIYDNTTNNGIGQGWTYRVSGCAGGLVDNGLYGALSPESHLIYVR